MGHSTDIVIEGYPRSANSYAVVAFESAQRNRVNIAALRFAEELKGTAKVDRYFGIALVKPNKELISQPIGKWIKESSLKMVKEVSTTKELNTPPLRL